MIYLINTPFFSGYKPSIALSSFKAQLIRAGLSSKVLDMQLIMSKHMGYDFYDYIARDLVYSSLLGFYFTGILWGDDFGTATEAFAEKRIKSFLPENHFLNNDKWRDHFKHHLIPLFYKSAFDLITRSGPPNVIGFSCNASQIMPSLALGKQIKQTYPETKLVYGGACFHDEMGREHIEKIPWIDAVSIGEADDIVVDLFKCLSKSGSPRGLKGVIYRQSDGLVKSGPTYRSIDQECFESLPTPDYTDFFETAEFSGCNNDPHWNAKLYLNFESSRGCSWGQRCVCTFCGLNGNNVAYRTKTADKVYSELSSYIEDYGVSHLCATDNIIPYDYFRTLLRKIIKQPFKKPISLEYEVKADVNREQVMAMVQAGVKRVQVGIENLSTNLLRLLRKGTNAIHNIFFLKLCRQYGITPFWIQMARIPGEKSEDYEWIEKLIPKIIHFHPPAHGTYVKVELERFSPYYSEKTKVRNIIPKPRYAYMYPSDHFDLSKIAYAFDADWEDTLGDDAYNGIKDAIVRWSLIWRDQFQLPELSIKTKHGHGGLTIIDTRVTTRPRTIELDHRRAALYQMLEDPISLGKLSMQLNNGNAPEFREGHLIRDILDEFVEEDLVVKEKSTYLALALPSNVPDLQIGRRFSP